MTVPSPHAAKVDWRRWARALDRPRRAEAGEVADRLTTWWGRSGLGPRRWVVAYDALPDEIDIGPAVRRLAAEHEVRVALTRTPTDGSLLTLHPADGPLERHRRGYRQPTAAAPPLDPGQVAVVLCPGLAFDRRGVRLGRGGGYYDRLLAGLDPAVIALGVASAHRVVDRLPAEPHDRPMDAVLTPGGVVEIQ